HPHVLHPFPTRRSSDLTCARARSSSSYVCTRYRKSRPLPRSCCFQPAILSSRGCSRSLSIAADAFLDSPTTLGSSMGKAPSPVRSEEHTSELQSRVDLV